MTSEFNHLAHNWIKVDDSTYVKKFDGMLVGDFKRFWGNRPQWQTLILDKQHPSPAWCSQLSTWTPAPRVPAQEIEDLWAAEQKRRSERFLNWDDWKQLTECCWMHPSGYAIRRSSGKYNCHYLPDERSSAEFGNLEAAQDFCDSHAMSVAIATKQEAVTV